MHTLPEPNNLGSNYYIRFFDGKWSPRVVASTLSYWQNPKNSGSRDIHRESYLHKGVNQGPCTAPGDGEICMKMKWYYEK